MPRASSKARGPAAENSGAPTRGDSGELSTPMNIAFFHPDLGLGGAERLIVDAAAALAKAGHGVTIYTSHYEAQRSFAETRDGSFKVQVHGDWLPRSTFGGFHIIWAIIRALWLAFIVSLIEDEYHVFIADQVSAYLPVLKLLRPATPVLFYCHFPDQLLSSRGSMIKRLYRLPFDAFERWTTAMADDIVVNSGFTKGVVEQTFGSALASKALQILYPCVDVPAERPKTLLETPQSAEKPIIFLSINRYERKKAIELAVDSFAVARSKVSSESVRKRMHLIIAGGYDTRVAENVAYYNELKQNARESGLLGASEEPQNIPIPSLGLSSTDFPSSPSSIESFAAITFIRSFADQQKKALLAASTAVLYTPQNEHFGIVPIEAMTFSRPVIACNSGGPLESVADGRTGYLCRPTKEVRSRVSLI
jgi:alpha-1,3/alpha-1,6-mannosyltransferase